MVEGLQVVKKFGKVAPRHRQAALDLFILGVTQENTPKWAGSLISSTPLTEEFMKKAFESSKSGDGSETYSLG